MRLLPSVPAVYRYLRFKDHAEAFVNGFVWVSTLEHIRKCDESRADPDEGKRTYQVEYMGPDTPTEQRAVIERRLGKAISIAAGDTLQDNFVSQKVPDAFMICTTTRFDDEMRSSFGQYCVRITKPFHFFLMVGSRLSAERALEDQIFAPMDYSGRTFKGTERELGHPAFLNVPGNAREQEERMVWMPRDARNLRPITVHAPDAARLCSLA